MNVFLWIKLIVSTLLLSYVHAVLYMILEYGTDSFVLLNRANFTILFCMHLFYSVTYTFHHNE